MKTLKYLTIFSLVFAFMLGTNAFAEDNSGATDEDASSSTPATTLPKPVREQAKLFKSVNDDFRDDLSQNRDDRMEIKDMRKDGASPEEIKLKLEENRAERIKLIEERKAEIAAIKDKLLEIAKKNSRVAEDVNAVADDVEQAGNDAVDSQTKIEERSKLKTFLFGSDYKNLGTLRSTLVSTQNQIDRLTKAKERTTNSTTIAEIDAQIAKLTEMKDKATNFVSNNESKFSLFGWVRKIFSQDENTDQNTGNNSGDQDNGSTDTQ